MLVRFRLLSIITFCGVLLSGCQSGSRQEASAPVPGEDAWTFVSIPDFLNVDTEYPQPGWEESLTVILDAVKNENPDFVLVPGDLVMGHWDAPSWNSEDSIVKYSAKYYSAWKARMQAHQLKFYAAIGDHEIGDNPWIDSAKVAMIPVYKQAFATHLQMPTNGPAHMQGTAFWWRHQNVLFVSVDVFEEGESDQGSIKPGVSGEQLAWLERVLLENKDATHKVIMGHTPVLGEVRRWSSSGLKIAEGRQSDFWSTMSRHGVDLYLCGEMHAMTCTSRDGVMQMVHGGLIGYNRRTSYLVVTVSGDRLYLSLKELEMYPSGDHLWQVGDNRPLKKLDVNPEGFEVVGRVVIDKSEGRSLLEPKGYFKRKYEESNEWAAAVFRQGVSTEMTKISLDD
ncbi:MAG: metallophosphoesterase [Marinoscillum sp.]|uniref:metallophosphoesterase family protein n=2 Tax=Marinoscillum sp. TaxID=2024838 RepID=UPI0032FCA625